MFSRSYPIIGEWLLKYIYIFLMRERQDREIIGGEAEGENLLADSLLNTEPSAGLDLSTLRT